MIKIRNLSISTDKYDVLTDLSLDIAEGERISIIGDSGSGKSTMGLAVLGYIAPSLRLGGGTITVDGLSVIKDGRIAPKRALRDIRTAIGRLDQDPAASLTPTHKIKRLLTELVPDNEPAFAAKSAEKQEAKQGAKQGAKLGASHLHADLNLSRLDALKTFALPATDDFLNRYPSEISGGQRRRVALARILLRRPRLLILDEPTSGLDSKTRDIVVEQVSLLQRKLGCSLLLITHDYEVASALCTRHMKLEGGKLTALDLMSVGVSNNKADLKDSCACQDKQAERPVLKIEALTASAPALKDAPIKDLSFEIHSGEALALTGGSGSGKSTVAKTLLGLWEKREGEMYLEGKTLPSSLEKRSASLKSALGWVPQDPITSFNPVLELGVSMKRARQRAMSLSREEPANAHKSEPLRAQGSYSLEDAIEMVGLSHIDWQKRLPKEMSGGQIQRLAIARAIVGGARVLILDEVTTSLDPTMRDEICKILSEIKKSIPMLVITHDEKVVSQLCDRRIDLK